MANSCCSLLVLLSILGLVAGALQGPYTTSGNRIIDRNGQPYRMKGVDRCSLEWQPDGDHISLGDFQASAGWGSMAVRVAVNQDFWLNGAAKFASNYKGWLQQTVNWIHQSGQDVILDLHWSDKGNLGNTNPGQQRCADVNSVQFWREVASTWKDDPNMFFELYNEPHDISWATWRNGGDSGDGFQCAGMQRLADAVRSVGANQVVIAGGLNWAYDLSQIDQYQLTGYNIAYATHVYDYPGKQPADWPQGWGNTAQKFPVVITEFGDLNCVPDYYRTLVSYASGLLASWTAWAWYPGGCQFPAIIEDWSYKPSVSGYVIQAALKVSSAFEDNGAFYNATVQAQAHAQAQAQALHPVLVADTTTASSSCARPRSFDEVHGWKARCL